MRAIKSWTMYEAMKYQVETYPGDVGNLLNLYNCIAGKEGDDCAKFWRRECLKDYEEHLEAESKIQLWIVAETCDWSDKIGKTVAVVGDRATAKAIARHHYKLDTQGHDFIVFEEPWRWV